MSSSISAYEAFEVERWFGAPAIIAKVVSDSDANLIRYTVQKASAWGVALSAQSKSILTLLNQPMIRERAHHYAVGAMAPLIEGMNTPVATLAVGWTENVKIIPAELGEVMSEYESRMGPLKINNYGIIENYVTDVDAVIPLYQPWTRLVSISRRAQTLAKSLSGPFTNIVQRERRILDTGVALGCQRERAAQIREDMAWTMLLVGKYNEGDMLEKLHFGRMHPLGAVMVERLVDQGADPEFALLFPHLVNASGFAVWPTRERFDYLGKLVDAAIQHVEKQDATRAAVKAILRF